MSELDEVLSHPFIARLAQALAARAPREVSADQAPEARRAAVALVHRIADGEPQLLLVKRAEYAGDPWSGHIALPGGRQESTDRSLVHTAVRETLEETALDLHRGQVLGAIDDLYPRNPVLPPLVVTPYVAVVPGEPSVALSTELADAFWVPVRSLEDPASRLEVELEVAGTRLRVPSFQHSGHTVWGMTHRILDQYLRIIASF